jgi:hypothetical protein
VLPKSHPVTADKHPYTLRSGLYGQKTETMPDTRQMRSNSFTRKLIHAGKGNYCIQTTLGLNGATKRGTYSAQDQTRVNFHTSSSKLWFCQTAPHETVAYLDAATPTAVYKGPAVIDMQPDAAADSVAELTEAHPHVHDDLLTVTKVLSQCRAGCGCLLHLQVGSHTAQIAMVNHTGTNDNTVLTVHLRSQLGELRRARDP